MLGTPYWVDLDLDTTDQQGPGFELERILGPKRDSSKMLNGLGPWRMDEHISVIARLRSVRTSFQRLFEWLLGGGGVNFIDS